VAVRRPDQRRRPPLHRLIIRNIRDEYGLRSREQRPARLTQC
jgi:hypothetical protein